MIQRVQGGRGKPAVQLRSGSPARLVRPGQRWSSPRPGGPGRTRSAERRHDFGGEPGPAQRRRQVPGVVEADQRRRPAGVVEDHGHRAVALVQAQPPPVRRVQRVPDEPADQEVVRDDQLTVVLPAGPGVAIDGRPGQLRSLGPLLGGVAGQQPGQRRRQLRQAGDRRQVVPEQARGADRDAGQPVGDQLRRLLRALGRAVPDGREPDITQPFTGCARLPPAGLGERSVRIGIAVSDQVEKSARHHDPFVRPGTASCQGHPAAPGRRPAVAAPPQGPSPAGIAAGPGRAAWR